MIDFQEFMKNNNKIEMFFKRIMSANGCGIKVYLSYIEKFEKILKDEENKIDEMFKKIVSSKKVILFKTISGQSFNSLLYFFEDMYHDDEFEKDILTIVNYLNNKANPKKILETAANINYKISEHKKIIREIIIKNKSLRLNNIKNKIDKNDLIKLRRKINEAFDVKNFKKYSEILEKLNKRYSDTEIFFKVNTKIRNMFREYIDFVVKSYEFVIFILSNIELSNEDDIKINNNIVY